MHLGEGMRISILGINAWNRDKSEDPRINPSFPLPFSVNLNSTAPNQLRGAYHGSECWTF